MNGAPFQKNEAMEQGRLKRRCIEGRITINANTSAASISATSQIPGLNVYVASNVQPTVPDPTANFGTLVSTTAPATIGLLVQSGDGQAFLGGRATLIAAGGTGATAPAFSAIAGAGVSTSGITALGNVAAILTAPGADLDAAIGTLTYWVELWYTSQ